MRSRHDDWQPSVEPIAARPWALLYHAYAKRHLRTAQAGWDGDGDAIRPTHLRHSDRLSPDSKPNTLSVEQPQLRDKVVEKRAARCVNSEKPLDLTTEETDRAMGSAARRAGVIVGGIEVEEDDDGEIVGLGEASWPVIA
jgi:hypothetical protein